MTRTMTVLLLATFATACDETDAPPPPVEITAIEVDAVEDLGVVLELRMRRQYCHDGVNHGTSTSASASSDVLHVDDRGSAMVWFGSFAAGRWSPTSGQDSYGASDGNYVGGAPSAPHRWTIDAKRIASPHANETRFELTWSHEIVEVVGVAPTRRGDTRVIALRDDDTYVLDALDLPRDDKGCDRGAFVDVVAIREEDPVLRDRTLGYDLWHVHTLPNGTELIARNTTSGRHGRDVEFTLPETRPPLERPLRLGDTEREVVLVPSGSLRGRIRQDGAVELLVSASLRLSSVELGAPATGWMAQRGDHAYRLMPGQTLRLELPPASGRWHADGDWTDAAEVLAGHHDALIITVTEG